MYTHEMSHTYSRAYSIAVFLNSYGKCFQFILKFTYLYESSMNLKSDFNWLLNSLLIGELNLVLHGLSLVLLYWYTPSNIKCS